MNRKILFKGKRIDNGEWVKGFFFKYKEKCYITNTSETYISVIYTEECVTDFNLRAYEVDPETVCQYTGLTDESGKEIYEGDVCEINKYPIDEDDGPFTVEWDDDDAKFALCGNGLMVDFDNYYGYECKVIGNIFDNPSLAEEEQ